MGALEWEADGLGHSWVHEREFAACSAWSPEVPVWGATGDREVRVCRLQDPRRAQRGRGEG